MDTTITIKRDSTNTLQISGPEPVCLKYVQAITRMALGHLEKLALRLDHKGAIPETMKPFYNKCPGVHTIIIPYLPDAIWSLMPPIGTEWQVKTGLQP